jgi:protein TonB
LCRGCSWRERNFVLASRSTFWSALCSCVVHILLVGSAAALMIRAPADTKRVVRVALLEQARPLTVGDTGQAGARTPVLASREERARTPQPPLRPRSKPVAKKPVRPRTVVAPTPVEKPEQVAPLVAPPVAPPVTDQSVTDLRSGNAGGRGEAGAGGVGGSMDTGAGKGNGGGGKISARPEYGVNPKPPYPLIARRLGAQGVVMLRVQVREDGSVAAIELARSSGFAVLDDSAVRTVRESWRFIPAQLDGAPVASWVEVPIRFVLEDS